MNADVESLQSSVLIQHHHYFPISLAKRWKWNLLQQGAQVSSIRLNICPYWDQIWPKTHHVQQTLSKIWIQDHHLAPHDFVHKHRSSTTIKPLTDHQVKWITSLILVQCNVMALAFMRMSIDMSHPAKHQCRPC